MVGPTAAAPEAAATAGSGVKPWTCVHCGFVASSRNALFRHLRESGCDPDIVKPKGKERVVLVVGYLGSRFHGMARNDEQEEDVHPSVEGMLMRAISRAWAGVE